MTKPDDIRPLAALDIDGAAAKTDIDSLHAFSLTAQYDALRTYFAGYPQRSLMGPHSRAVLYSLIRMTQPKVVAEIGTLFAGTTELMARALWENGNGSTIHTTDPFGAERCPSIIAGWPASLRGITHYHSLNSMAFFGELDRRRIPLDMILIDGNHDYEYALFDLQMAARAMRPGGIVVMDNSDQSGPLYASKDFLAVNPGWREIGSALAGDEFHPFDSTRTSLWSGTSFILLQAPRHLAVGTRPFSRGQTPTEQTSVAVIRIDLPEQFAAGVLFYRVFLRAFANGNLDIHEYRAEGSVRLQIKGRAEVVAIKLPEPLHTDMKAKYSDAHITFEIDLAWHPEDPTAPPLLLANAPAPEATLPFT